jgi:hypothetical protein
MKAYLIDPEKQSVEQVDYTGVYTNIYEHIGEDCFAIARFNEKGDCVYVDDNGLLKPQRAAFLVNGYRSFLVGKGLVLGTDYEGESVEPKCSLEWLKQNTAFFSLVGKSAFLTGGQWVPPANYLA